MKHSYFTLVFLGLFLIINISIIAQEKTKEIVLQQIKGDAIGNDNESISQVTQKAINNAKIEALNRAGVEENISSYTDYFQSEVNDNYEELFTTDILSDIRGAVKGVEILNTEKEFNEFGNLCVEVTINCTVIKYNTTKDLTFDVWVDGIGLFYQDNSRLIFKVKPSKDSYVKMFLFNETESYQLFPSTYEKSFLLNKDNEITFPGEAVDYILFTDKESEAHRLIMVFTKEEIPYTGKIEYKEIINWIFSIPPDMRVLKTSGFSVVKEDKIIE
jgi:hypothetical protein